MSQQVGLRPDENRRAHAALQTLLRGYASQADLARHLEMPDGNPPSQQAVSAALKPGGQVGVTLTRAIAQALGITFDELVTGVPSARAGGEARELYEQIPGWADVAADLLRRQAFPRYAVAAVGRMPVWLRPARMTVEFAYDLLAVWMRHASLDERLQAEAMELNDQEARDRAADENRRHRVAFSGTVARSDTANGDSIAEAKSR